MNPIAAKAAGEGKATQSYKSKFKPTWCAGCGDYSVLAALDKALNAFGRPEHQIAIVSGIGCSSRFPYFMNTYGIHAAHGRALAVATGLKTARPELTVIATSGDGDALAIGGNHFFHTMRRNVDLTYLLMDNQIYAMTKGQTAPTSQIGFQSKSTPYGAYEPPIDPVWMALTMGATFVAQGASFDVRQLTDLILRGLRHPGAAFINILSPCVTFNKEIDKDFFRGRSEPVSPDHDPADYDAALALMRRSPNRFLLGLIYVNDQAPSFGRRIDEQLRERTDPSIEQDYSRLFAEFL
jgi:2-oxoglutarate ferredoxin oxidoreductase subunit beta